MAHPLVEQLRFTRAEWRRALRGVPEADGRRHVGPMNSIGFQRVIYHYLGEILAIRQVLEHPSRPEFVGEIDTKAPYRSRA